jgi:hypothetical protein
MKKIAKILLNKTKRAVAYYNLN